MNRAFQIGDKFQLREENTDQYPQKYHNKTFTVVRVFGHAIPASEMSKDSTGHPGFDAFAGSLLYEADGLPFAMYDWEMEPI